MPSKAQVHSWIESALRRRFVHFSSEYQAALDKVKEERWVKCKGKNSKKSERKEVWYTCTICQQKFRKSKIEVDHIIPVIDPNVGFVTWEVYIERLWCDVSNLQAICKSCHRRKTDEQRKARLHNKVRPIGKSPTRRASKNTKRPRR